MKSSLILGLILLTAHTASAQVPENPGRPISPQRRAGTPGSPAPGSRDDLKRFDLDFPGGTPSELSAAISKATGKHLNLVIPTQNVRTQIMPLKVVGVTVPELFNAIQQASYRQVPVVSGIVQGSSRQRQMNIQYKSVALQFLPSTHPETDDTVWSFQSTEPTAEEEAVLSQVSELRRVCQYFQLAPYLEDHTVEDITTAIETGWKMLGAEPAPKLSFHQETKLLIAVGAPDYVEQIPAVLQQLPLDNSAAVEKLAEAMAESQNLKETKPPGWEKKLEEIEARMKRLGQREAARKALRELTRENTPPKPPGPVPAK
jgi:hypothetical protein